jgi:hypothetical protein
MATGLNQTEKEVVFLKAIYDLINSMVNHEMLTVFIGERYSSIRFKSTTHFQLFTILLTDFLSQTDKDASGDEKYYVDALKFISEYPSFNVNNSVASLREATSQLWAWLDDKEPIKVWLPTISTETTLKVARIMLIKMCGNIAKHNFLRLIRVATQFKKILHQSGVSVTLHEALLTLDDFYQNWGLDILRYFGSPLAEFLNNVRWGIYDYLQPEFRRSFTRIEGDPHGRYEYKYPSSLTADFATECYWNLMNDLRSKPFFARFEVPEIAKSSYFQDGQ